jgi:hypothetical protein
MYWLFRDTFLYVIGLGAAVVPAGIIAQTMGGYLGKLFEIDPQLIMGVVFFAVFGLEVYLFDLARKWWFFRARQ